MTETPPKATWPPEQPEEDLVYEPRGATHGRYTRTQIVMVIIGLIGLAAGVGLGLLYTWGINPVIEQNTRPDQLNPIDKQNFVIAVALDYGENGDLDRAYTLLGQVEPGQDPFQIAADTLCEMTRTGQVQTAADIRAMRQLIAIFQPQNVAADCDISIYSTSPPPTLVTRAPTITPSPTIQPIATKTPTIGGPTPTPFDDLGSPTAVTSRQDYVVAAQAPFCDPERDGIIIVRVRDENGFPQPGIEILVTWTNARGQQEETFFTGLKPEQNDGYADFQMEPGETYQVGLVGRSGLSDPMPANQSCGEDGTLSYEIIFQPRR